MTLELHIRRVTTTHFGALGNTQNPKLEMLANVFYFGLSVRRPRPDGYTVESFP